MFTDAANMTTPASDASGELVLKPVQYQDTNGNEQTIYVQQPTPAQQPPSQGSAHQKLHFHLSTIFLALGILSFGLGIFVTFKKIKQ